jgi:hypothetical protein
LLNVLIVLVGLAYLALARIDEPVREGIYENILANLITAGCFTILAATAFISLSVIRRRRLFTFFGIQRGAMGIRFYLGQLQVQAKGTKGVEEVRNGYQGPAIVKFEYDACLMLQDLFRPRVTALIPEVLRELLSALFITLAEVDARIEMSPTLEQFSPGQHLAENIVSCGAGTYNAISHHYLTLARAFYSFGRGEDGVRVMRFHGESPLDFAALGRANNNELACIQRFKDTETGNAVFICAGIGSGATFGAVDYLVGHWNDLRRRYHDREFGVCLSFAHSKSDELPASPARVIHQVVRPKSG